MGWAGAVYLTFNRSPMWMSSFSMPISCCSCAMRCRSCQALLLAPTRELAEQTQKVMLVILSTAILSAGWLYIAKQSKPNAAGKAYVSIEAQRTAAL